MSAKVSILMPVYNGMPYLPLAIESVLGQTLRAWKCVIVNDGSTDGTADYLASLRDERFVVLHRPNGGISSAVNRGLPYCDTRYVARLDADDIALPSRLAEQTAFLNANSEVGVVGSQVAPLGDRTSGASVNLPLDHNDIMAALLTGRHGMAHSATMIRRELLEQVGGYWSLPYGEEYDLLLRIGERSQLANLNRVLVHYRVHARSMNGSGMRKMRTHVAYAGDAARRRAAKLPEITLDQFMTQLIARPWWMRAAEAIEIHARNQYRVALAERHGGRKVVGTARLAWAAFCSPQLTFERLVRTARSTPPSAADVRAAVEPRPAVENWPIVATEPVAGASELVGSVRG